MQKKAVLITGSAGGIGQALIAAFTQNEWNVVTLDSAPMSRSAHIQCDLAEIATDIDKMNAVGHSISQYTKGNLACIINNAALQIVKPVAELTPADWLNTLSVNLLSPFFLVRHFLNELSQNHGSVINISSIHERLTKPDFVAYATSKAALSGMTRAMAVELGERIRFNAICPAAIATPMLKAGFSDNPTGYEQLANLHPTGAIGAPEEVAQLAFFMAGSSTPFLNGATIDLNGGIGARLHDPI